MKTITIGDFEAHFSEVIQEIKTGEEIALTAGNNEEIFAYLIPKLSHSSRERQLGILADKGKVTFADGFKMTEEEFLGL